MILTTWMAHQRKLIRRAAVALLVSAGTAAGARVKSTRVEAHKPGQLPAISVYALSEDTDPTSADTAPIELTRHLKLEIAGWVVGTDALPVDDAMDDLAEQIEAAMAADYYITQALTVTAVNHVTGRLTIPAHGLVTGSGPVTVVATGAGVVPAGIRPSSELFAIVVDANTIKLATSSANALAGTALTFTTDGTLPVQLRIGTVADQLLASTEMQVVEDDGRSDPLVGIVTLTYAITYRTSPAAGVGLDAFVTVDVKQKLVGGVADTLIAEDTFTEAQ